jgi:hypothetical protein
VSGLHAVRVAAKLRRDLQIEVDTEHGRYGEYKILVDGEIVVDGGALAVLGVLPSAAKSIAAVRDRLSRT